MFCASSAAMFRASTKLLVIAAELSTHRAHAGSSPFRKATIWQVWLLLPQTNSHFRHCQD